MRAKLAAEPEEVLAVQSEITLKHLFHFPGEICSPGVSKHAKGPRQLVRNIGGFRAGGVGERAVLESLLRQVLKAVDAGADKRQALLPEPPDQGRWIKRTSPPRCLPGKRAVAVAGS